MNGKSIEVDNTDAEGRLILSGKRLISFLSLPSLIATSHTDALYYVSSEYKPHTLVDVATLTGVSQNSSSHHMFY